MVHNLISNGPIKCSDKRTHPKITIRKKALPSLEEQAAHQKYYWTKYISQALLVDIIIFSSQRNCVDNFANINA